MKLEINDPSAEECFKMLNIIEEAFTVNIELKGDGGTLWDYVVFAPCYGNSTIEVAPFGSSKTLTLKFEDIETLKVNIG
jgi:hypothetical protein